MPLVSIEHTSIDRAAKKAVASMQSRFLPAVSVVVVALQGKENIHNPRIVASPAITNKRRAAAPTPAEPQNSHSRVRRANGPVCPYKFCRGAMKAGAQRSEKRIPHIPPLS